MNNKLAKFIAIISTFLLTISVIVTNVCAVTVDSSISSIHRTSAALSSKENYAGGSALVSSSSKIEQADTSSQVNTSSVIIRNRAATNANNSDGYIGKYSVVTEWKYGESHPVTMKDGSGYYPHFNVNDDIGKAYCYNWDMDAPDNPGRLFNGYNFWNGAAASMDSTKSAQVTSALFNGYHLNKDTKQWEINPAFNDVAQQSYEDFYAEKSNSLSDPISEKYSQEDFEQDVTQSVIWVLSGAQLPDNRAALAYSTEFGKQLLSYAKEHPMDQQTSEAQNIKIVSDGNTVDPVHPLVIDAKSLKSQTFQLNNYNEPVKVSNLPNGISIIDNATGKATNNIEPGKSYYLKADSINTASANIKSFDVNYQKVADSHYFSVVDLNTSSDKANNPYQNLVNLATETLKLPISYVFTSNSSSSSVVSSSSSKAKSSSIVSSSSSKIKSSSIASSSSSKAKSSSIASSSSSKVKSSSIVSSSSSKAKSSPVANNSLHKATSLSNVSKKSNNAILNTQSNKHSGTKTNHGKGNKHGLPETGEMTSALFIIIGTFVLIITGGLIILRKH